MKVSLNLAQEYANVDLKAIPRDELLRRIGAQLGAVEEVTEWAPKFGGAIIVRVVSCEKHPDANRLNVCRIDDGGQTQGVERGEDGLIQVVCGAPNARADIHAVWLRPGVTVPNSRDTDPFVLEAIEIRGVLSNGMLASAHELGISDDHGGIVEVSQESARKVPVPGEPLTNYFDLDDVVIDCENKMFTHRPDCFGVLGVARELAGISGLKFESPAWYLRPPQFGSHSDLPLTVKNEESKLVPRFMAVAMKDISVGPSPLWLQSVLTRSGIKPINNVVDVTNYVMQLTGQPLHAFDYDKIKARSTKPGIFPRMSEKGEKLTLLGQKEITLTGEEIVISTDKQAVGLAGVMGGAETEVDADTKHILIEAATFDMYSIRRTSMRFGLFTDAVTRYNKGQSPAQNDRVLAFTMELLSKYAGAAQASDVIDAGDYLKEEKQVVNLPLNFINDRLGSSLSIKEVTALLANVEISNPSKVTIAAYPPFWRMDLEQPEDIVEEIGRLYGYDKLPVALPTRSVSPTPKNTLFEYKAALRKNLSRSGANEVLTYSFVHGDLLTRTGTDPERWAYHLRNALSPDLQYYRTSLIPSLLNKVHQNIKAQAGDDRNRFALFEIGKAHVVEHKENGLPVQMERLALVVAADDKTAKSRQFGAAYYMAKTYLEAATGGQAELTPIDNFDYPITSPYAPGRSAVITVGGETLGAIGEFRANVRSALKLPNYSAGFEIDIEALQKYLSSVRYQPLPTFPSVHQDLTLEVPDVVEYAKLWTAVDSSLKNLCVVHGYVADLEPRDIFQAEGDGMKRITFRVTVSHDEKTLKTEEVTRLTDQLAGAAAGLNARRI